MDWRRWLGLKAPLPPQAQLPERQPVAVAAPVGRPSWQFNTAAFTNPFLFVPQHQNLHLYEQLVETVPVLNGGISRIVQFVGSPKVKTDDEAGKQDLEDWWKAVSANRVQIGGGNWFPAHVQNHLIYGRAHAEIILRADATDVYALQELHPRTVEQRPRADAYGIDLVQRQIGTGLPVLLPPERILTSVHDVRGDSPQGNSILYGLPFSGEIYEKILRSLKNIWTRYGVPVYQVRWVPPDGFNDPTGAKGAAVAQVLAATLQDVMLARENGQIRDFAAAGEVDLNLIGAEGEALDPEVPGRLLVEQMVSKIGIPPFLLGLMWATTERMSQVQADLLSEMIDEIREHLEAQVAYLWRLRQAIVGRPFEFEVCWEAPSLMDAMTSATAEKAQAEAESAKLKWLEREWTLGIRSNLDVARIRRPELAGMTDAQIRRALPLLLAEPPQPPAPVFGGGGQQNQPPEPQPAPPTALRSVNYGETWPVKNGRHP